jgi:tetraacyldisaccharide 4'-kinase
MNLLSPFGWLYGLIAATRNSFYDREIFRSSGLGARTISIGNITVGGTGKTPLVALAAEILAQRGEKVCILTRGYGRRDPGDRVLVSDGDKVLADAKTGGDEPVELARKLLGKAVVIADANRVSAAKWALENFSVTVFLLDDGFQHRRAKRDLNIVCIDATDPFGGGKVVPAGRLREPVSRLSRADIVVITRCDLVDSTEPIKAAIRENANDVSIFTASSEMAGLVPLERFLSGDPTPRSIADTELADAAFVFCALAKPENFIRQIARAGIKVSGSRTFRDHHFYSQHDIAKIEADAAQMRSTALVTTAKDAVKLAGLNFTLPCFVALSELKMNDEASFTDLLASF